jgi:2-haloacid dehalogenase
MTGRLDDIGGIERLTFDCYGTLVDWEAGMQGSFRALGAGVEHHRAMIEAYIRTEAAIEQQGYQPYRDIQRIALARVAREFGLTVSEHQQDLLSTSLPRWPVFADTTDALHRLGSRFKLGIVSNIDRDLFDATAERLGVRFDQVITAEDVRAYKPAHPHFLRMIEQVGDRSRMLHVAQSLYHDGGPARELGIRFAWINRYGGSAGDDVPMVGEYATLSDLADALGV